MRLMITSTTCKYSLAALSTHHNLGSIIHHAVLGNKYSEICRDTQGSQGNPNKRILAIHAQGSQRHLQRKASNPTAQL